ncbi:uncharacterized protein LOC127260892 [Andrographis paniculata]|uniref:uncharacterized protein LOC127260892 n=1 Tax=Andrographis paniculata TaxID=175694 RepID=UPI0021E76596|nr:uncharacterized protein LOC127260892 [Andrographis paniculata]
MIRSLLSTSNRRGIALLTARGISSTPYLSGSWMDKIKGIISGEKSAKPAEPADSFTLLWFADQMGKARKLGALKKFVGGGGGNEAAFIEKQEAVLRFLGGCDPSGQNIQASQKKEAAKNCNCTVADVEVALAKFTWAKQAQKKIEQLKAEGKPMPKNIEEVQKLVGSSPLEAVRSNLSQSGQISRNSPCPCGSRKLYKRCCGKDNN